MSGLLEKRKFKEINIQDPFFDSLKSDYQEFSTWFYRKAEEEAYVFYEDGHVQGFLYLKQESGPILDITPNILGDILLKIGTFKINPHGTRLGERFIKKALDYAITIKAVKCYVTIFEKHQGLVELLERYGFVRIGIKQTQNGNEMVLVKNLSVITGDILMDYPLINTDGNQKFVLSIYPQYHSNMFPDSILKNENINILEDVSYTNSIHKIYVTRMKVYKLEKGDILVMYRTKPEGKSAKYGSVVTSVCVVEEVRGQNEFDDFEHFYTYATTYSIFDRNDLEYWYNRGGCYTVKMTYNAALSKRLIRNKLIEDMGIDRDNYWGFFRLSNEQFNQILKEGGVLEGIVIN
jgi:hypothetical protein